MGRRRVPRGAAILVVLIMYPPCVCAYRARERGVHGGLPAANLGSEFAILLLDVLRRRGEGLAVSLRGGELGHGQQVALDERLPVHVTEGERVGFERTQRVLHALVAFVSRSLQLALELLVNPREPAEVGAEVVPLRLRREQAASHREVAPDELLGGHASKVLVEGRGRVTLGSLRAGGRRRRQSMACQ